MSLTVKQKTWDAYKAAQRDERRRPSTPNPLLSVPQTGSFYRDPARGRGVRTPVMPASIPRGRCPACPHGWKHHSEAGNCRRGCGCGNGANR